MSHCERFTCRRSAASLVRAAVLAGAGVLLLCPAAAAQSGVDIDVRVIDAATETPLDGATVRLDDEAHGLTSAAGRFVIRGVPPRAYTLTIERIGYRTREMVVRVASDTTIVVRLVELAIPLDTLAVTGRSITLHGEVIGTDTRRAVPDADVRYGDRETATSGSGFFRLGNVTADAPATLLIAGPGYLPRSVTVTASRDTTLRIELQPDPAAQRMIARQIQRLHRRMRGAPTVGRHFSRDDLLRHGAASVGEALKLLGGTRGAVRCIIIDERPWYDGMQVLEHFTPEEVERVEYVAGTLRIYTFSFVRRRMAARQMLVQIVPNICQ